MSSFYPARLAYLLLGQEEYKEHHSEITQCKFSGSGCVIGKFFFVSLISFVLSKQ
jgi:hypothetical protein